MEIAWHDWWQRHNLLACRDGGLFPALYIRRVQDAIEFSWGDRPVARVRNTFASTLTTDSPASILMMLHRCCSTCSTEHRKTFMVNE